MKYIITPATLDKAPHFAAIHGILSAYESNINELGSIAPSIRRRHKRLAAPIEAVMLLHVNLSVSEDTFHELLDFLEDAVVFIASAKREVGDTDIKIRRKTVQAILDAYDEHNGRSESLKTAAHKAVNQILDTLNLNKECITHIDLNFPKADSRTDIDFMVDSLVSHMRDRDIEEPHYIKFLNAEDARIYGTIESLRHCVKIHSALNLPDMSHDYPSEEEMIDACYPQLRTQ